MKDDALAEELRSLRHDVGELQIDSMPTARLPRPAGHVLDRLLWVTEHLAVRLDQLSERVARLEPKG